MVMVAAAMAAGGAGACVELPPEVPEEGAIARAVAGERAGDGTLEGAVEVALEKLDRIPNNFLVPNARGFAASFGTDGFVALDNAFFTPQGSNGRHCGTCHTPAGGWSIDGAAVTALFLATGGTHPIFASHIDTDTPTADMSTVQARWEATTMLRQGKFTRRASPPAVRDYDVIDARDPFGVGTTERLFWFRRPLPTASFRSHAVNWDGANTVGTRLRDGLSKQVPGNVIGAQEGPPPSGEVVREIVDFELQLAHAQLIVWEAGRLDADGARGGPAYAAAQPLVAGRFDLYDAWEGSSNAKRRQIKRGQDLFNRTDERGRSCGGCHNAANNGQHASGRFFDIHTSRPELARPDMAVYRFQRRTELPPTAADVLETTDPGLGLRSGRFDDLGKLKVPNLRGLASRAPYFHNGIAADLTAVVRHYEAELGFRFTPDEEADLVAFLEAL
jgi:cytochrome c peroxidase